MMTSGLAQPPVRVWLRLEGGAILLACVTAYSFADYSWILFAALLLAPDLTLLGYLAGPRLGSYVYNTAHSYIGPALLAVVMIGTSGTLAVPMIWAAHSGFDRLLGYGLKYPNAFRDTHLGPIGRK
jgi:hypothetical protein